MVRVESKLSSPRTESFTLFTRRVLAQLAGIMACAYLMCVGADAQVAGGVLSGAVTVSQLQSNLEAPSVRLTAAELDALAALAEPAERYWSERQALPWS